MGVKPSVTLKKIASLMNSLDGVNVLDAYATKNSLRLYFTIESHKSHMWLEHCAEAANIPLNCSCKCKPWEQEAVTNPALALIYRFEAIKRKDGSHNLKNFKMLGAQLVWLMHSFEIIKTKKANRLLELWNCMRIEKQNKEKCK